MNSSPVASTAQPCPADAPAAVYCPATAAQPGAIGVIFVLGASARDVIERLIGQPMQRATLRITLAGIDELMICRVHDKHYQLMPHGSPVAMRLIAERLEGHGAVALPHDQIDPVLLYPEARCCLEAMALHAMAFATSPAACDLMLNQVTQWCRWMEDPQPQGVIDYATARHLFNPPTVAVVGPANVGKSTLVNMLVGRSVSITQDLPGTTRDWVRAMLTLESTVGPIAVQWMDTAGLRQAAQADAIEARAIELTRAVLDEADVLVAMRDVDTDWPEAEGLPRAPELWVVNKADRRHDALPTQPGTGARDDPMMISATRGWALGLLGRAITAALGFRASSALPIAFHEQLEHIRNHCEITKLQRLLADIR